MFALFWYAFTNDGSRIFRRAGIQPRMACEAFTDFADKSQYNGTASDEKQQPDPGQNLNSRLDGGRATHPFGKGIPK